VNDPFFCSLVDDLMMENSYGQWKAYGQAKVSAKLSWRFSVFSHLHLFVLLVGKHLVLI
jgi:hypothetical protein